MQSNMPDITAVFVCAELCSDEEIPPIKRIIQTAAESGLNSLVLNCGADTLARKPPEFVARIVELKTFAGAYGMEIIPAIFGIGYGGAILAHNKNLAEGLPVMDALFVARGGEAVFVPDSPPGLLNGSFEELDGSRVAHFTYEGASEQAISVDTSTFRDGQASLRFTAKADAEHRPTVSQVFAVQPHRAYRVSAWVKAEGMDPAKPFGEGNIDIKTYAAADNHQLEWININAPASGNWFRVDLGFNSLDYDSVRIVVGPGYQTTGTFWIDGLEVHEVGLLNVLRRPGTPVTVVGERDGAVYQEGVDFAEIADPSLNFNWDHEGPSIRLLPGSRIREGERLRVSYYHGTHIYDIQVPICMSEPQVYEIWRESARLMKEQLGFRKFLLCTDEVRAGGTCAACKTRNLPMSNMLGECITSAYTILKEVEPDAEIFIWSDMIDPNHNAGAHPCHGGLPYYYHVPYSYYGVWEHIPKDLIVVCWWTERREKSLGHFSSQGFRTMGSVCCDASPPGDQQEISAWLESLKQTPGAIGIMYTTWQSKYDRLSAFADLVAQTADIDTSMQND